MCGTNSGITFISKAYSGRLSVKKITLESGFLDRIPSSTTIMADKGFNLIDESPSDKRGITQMTPAQLSITSSIAKVRILVEQVIQHVRAFKIHSNEILISLLGHINDILIVCVAVRKYIQTEPLIFN